MTVGLTAGRLFGADRHAFDRRALHRQRLHEPREEHAESFHIGGLRVLRVIKPSGLRYEYLTPSSMVVCDLDGNVVDGAESPSSDTASHAYIYRHMPDVYGVVHTHSTYATAWAATGQNIRCARSR